MEIKSNKRKKSPSPSQRPSAAPSYIGEFFFVRFSLIMVLTALDYRQKYCPRRRSSFHVAQSPPPLMPKPTFVVDLPSAAETQILMNPQQIPTLSIKKIPCTQTQDSHDVFDGASQDRLSKTPQDGLSDTPQDSHDAPDDTAQDGRDPSLTPPPNTQLPTNSPPLSRILLSPFIEQAPPSRCVWVDDNSDEEGGYAALLRLATATPTTSPAVASTAINGVVVISDDESPITSKAAIASTSVIVISDSDSEDEYFVSDIELTNATVAELDGSYTPLVFPDSDDEYDFSDIELTDALIAELDMIC